MLQNSVVRNLDRAPRRWLVSAPQCLGLAGDTSKLGGESKAGNWNYPEAHHSHVQCLSWRPQGLELCIS